jgi:hypothetical protein
VDCAPPFLTARFAVPQRMLGGRCFTRGLPCLPMSSGSRFATAIFSVDRHAFLKARLAEPGFPNVLAFMTSRDIRRHGFASDAPKPSRLLAWGTRAARSAFPILAAVYEGRDPALACMNSKPWGHPLVCT